MKYDIDQEFKEILGRSRQIRKKREETRLKILSGVTAVMVVVLAAMIARLTNGEQMEAEAQYGSYMLSSEAGGYVLVAVAAFVLGIVVTFLCLRYTKKKKETGEDHH